MSKFSVRSAGGGGDGDGAGGQSGGEEKSPTQSSLSPQCPCLHLHDYHSFDASFVEMDSVLDARLAHHGP